MGWISRWRRMRALRHRLAVSDNHYDALAVERDQLNALDKLLGGQVAAREIAALYAILDVRDALVDADYISLIEELEELELHSRSLRLKRGLLDVVLAAMLAVVFIVRVTLRLIRRLRTCKRRRPKTPAPPDDDESSRFSCQVVRVQLYPAMIFSYSYFQ